MQEGGGGGGERDDSTLHSIGYKNVMEHVFKTTKAGNRQQRKVGLLIKNNHAGIFFTIFQMFCNSSSLLSYHPARDRSCRTVSQTQSIGISEIYNAKKLPSIQRHVNDKG